ncbi:DUF2306 domain-containing protein [Roseomonas nepalensis]|uniref:DUF2306 domain-containing protein n=1 Tax=Muricoccus nepalensis TaxID=1854500 RepID=A0A502FGC5_9PROT|nr:DUF2306 domain-containing protein [Roseomonas nepalensis]TPG48399.1 DUF2306 domain-containing protein [Roseomonas nepalensis]
MPIPVLAHLAFSSLAMLTVPIALFLPKLGGWGHRLWGRLAAAGLIGAALSALFVARHGPSPLHVLAIALLLTVARAVHQARHGRIASHRRLMLIAGGSLYVAGAAAILIPGRLAHRLLFG